MSAAPTIPLSDHVLDDEPRHHNILIMRTGNFCAEVILDKLYGEYRFAIQNTDGVGVRINMTQAELEELLLELMCPVQRYGRRRILSPTVYRGV